MTQLYHTGNQQTTVTQLSLFVLSKVCLTCGIDKPVEDYTPQKNGLYGRTAHCRDCVNAKARAKTLAKNGPPQIPHPGFKFCATCNIEKPLNAFTPLVTGKYGCVAHCRECVNAENRAKTFAKNGPQPVPRPGYKFCGTCHAEKLLEEFTPLIDGKYGRVAHCRACVNAKGKEKRAAKQALKPIPKPGFKFCNQCSEEKPLDAFETEGVYTRNTCKQCRIEYRKVYYRRIKDRPEYKMYRQWYQSTPEYKEKNRANVSRWQHTPRGRELANAYARMYNRTPKRKEFDQRRRQNHIYKQQRSSYFARPDVKQHINAINKRRYATDPDYALKKLEIRERRKALKLQTQVEKIDYKAILEENDGTCYLCNKAIHPYHKIEFDHIIPLARKGPHTKENIAVTHATCNRRKRHKLVSELSDFDRRGPDN